MFKVFGQPQAELKKIAVLLPGRGQPAVDFLARYGGELQKVPGVGVMALEPIDEWYPSPNGADDQDDAVWGLKVTVPELNDYLSDVASGYNLSLSDIFLIGFSAGAVVALQAMAHADQPYAAVVSHCGAILAPDDLPENRHGTPILLLHSKYDDCFSWDERYVPMLDALRMKWYNVNTADCCGHHVSAEDVLIATSFLADFV